MANTETQKPANDTNIARPSASPIRLPPLLLKARPLTSTERFLSELFFHTDRELISLDSLKKAPNWLHRR
jgi:hypothetical protein